MKSQESYIPPKGLYNTVQIDHIAFSVLRPEEMLGWSVLQVTESKIYQGIHPKRGGVNDARMGIIKPGQKCETCGLGKECIGHFGHIKLAQPVYHLGYLKYVLKILKCICLNCSKLKYYTSEQQKNRFNEIMTIGNPAKRMGELAKLFGSTNMCPLFDSDGQKLGCGSFIPTKFTIKEKMRLFVLEKDDKKNSSEVEYSALRVRTILEKIDPDDCKILGFTSSSPTSLIISVVPVAPPQVRPPVELGPEKRAEDDITNAYARIVAYNNQIKQGLDNYKRTLNIREIQLIVGAIMTKLDQKSMPALKEKSNKKGVTKKIKSLEERLISKQGRFRQHLMGKRVDFCARSVITPDPFIALDQVGVPESIACSMTFPQQINEFNYDKILNLCKKGKVKFLVNPKSSDGKKQTTYIYLKKYNTQEIQEFVKIGMIAERQLEDGDYVLFNRQPTLHRMSMMGHRVRILPHNTFRLNLSVCSPYNADFDGDEMNMHVPQSVQAVAELQFLAGVPHQIINPKNSTPIMGIVQDSLLGIYLMTMRDTFITRPQLMNLIMWMDPLTKFQYGNLPMPCILKPQPLWSGKQVISMILPEKITLIVNKSKETLSNRNDKENLIIKDGELLSGVLKRDHVGPGSGKLIQAIWIQKGAQAACDFITNIQRVVTNWFMNYGFSVGLADVKPSQDLEQERHNEIQKTIKDYYKNIHIFRNLPRYIHENFHQKGKKVAESMQYKVNLDLNNSLSRMQGIVSKSVSAQENNICKMIDAKSKGSETNLTQIMFCLGNQNVDGQRCPQGFRKRALPHFSKDDNSPQPRGFVFSSFYHGLQPHEFFFHSMAGREGLSDTAVKTSNIGYIQRKLVKALEDVSVRYDGTVRDSRDNILQRFYGEDGFQPEFIERHKINQCLLRQDQFEAIYKWKENQLCDFVLSNQELRLISQEYQFLLQARQILREKTVGQGQINVEYQCPINIQRLVDQQISNRKIEAPEQVVEPGRAIRIVQELSRRCILPRFNNNFNDEMNMVEKAEKQGRISHDKLLLIRRNLIKEYGAQIFNIHLKFWLCSIKIYYKYRLSEKQLRTIAAKIFEKYKRVLVSAGQAIGSLAAQSIGEPTTQMTLNTFHLAGVADKNVTLGIPRLRQLLNVSKNIQTPYITIYPKYPLLWEDRESEQSQALQNIMLETIPQRSLRHYLVESKIYFDPGRKISHIDETPVSEIQANDWTPWVISLNFQKEKITSTNTWRLILNTLEKNLGKEFTIIQYVGIGQKSQPQINLRLNSETIQRIGQVKAFKHLNLREMELREYPLSGIAGISAVKTARKKGYNVGLSEQLSLSLDQCIEQLVFEAVGSNLKKVLSNPLVDARRTVSNNLYQIYQTLGIQAARKCFLNEFREILKPYNITINPRHLDILIQWMTFRGNLVPINRFGINRVRDVSVLRKATFEQTADILYNAAVFSQSDQLKGVSEKIIFGQKLSMGTNICRIYIDEKKVANFVYQPRLSLDINENNEKNEEKHDYEQVTKQQYMRTPLAPSTPKRQQYTFQNPYLETPFARSQILSSVYDVSPKRGCPTPSPSYSDASSGYELLGDPARFRSYQNSSLIDKSPVYNHNIKFEHSEQKRDNSLSPSYKKMSFSTSQGYTKETSKTMNASRPVRPSESTYSEAKHQHTLDSGNEGEK